MFYKLDLKKVLQTLLRNKSILMFICIFICLTNFIWSQNMKGILNPPEWIQGTWQSDEGENNLIVEFTNDNIIYSIKNIFDENFIVEITDYLTEDYYEITVHLFFGFIWHNRYYIPIDGIMLYEWNLSTEVNKNRHYLQQIN